MADADKESFFSRWSRLKRKAEERAPEKLPAGAADPKAQAPQLPPLDTLGFDSDYRVFLDPKVDEETRRAALKKLFSDPRFNEMDGLDVYIDDYSKGEPLPAEMLERLRQAQTILEAAKPPAAEAGEQAPSDHQPPEPRDT